MLRCDVACWLAKAISVLVSRTAYRLHDVSEVHQLLALLADGVTAESRA